MGINEGPSFELYMERVQNIMDTAASVDKPADRGPSREVVARAYALDAYVSLAGCDLEHARHSLLDMLVYGLPRDPIASLCEAIESATEAARLGLVSPVVLAVALTTRDVAVRLGIDLGNYRWLEHLLRACEGRDWNDGGCQEFVSPS